MEESKQPDNCPEEFVEEICNGCPFRDYTMVSHPGGDSYHTVEQYYCGFDHWREEF